MTAFGTIVMEQDVGIELADATFPEFNEGRPTGRTVERKVFTIKSAGLAVELRMTEEQYRDFKRVVAGSQLQVVSGPVDTKALRGRIDTKALRQ